MAARREIPDHISDDPRQWIVAVCREAREDAQLNRTAIAGEINQGEDVIRRFETLRGKWSQISGQIVQAYSIKTGIPEWELWQMAIDRWREAQAEAQDDQSRRPPAHPPKAPPRAAQNIPAKDQKQAGS